jgi:DNA-binding GntR family transcriptional regulator
MAPPLFRFSHILDQMRSAILDGTLKGHDPLPSERVVAAQYDVSRMTARRALEALEAEGLAYNENRRGRFVSPQRVSYNVSEMVSFVAGAQASDADLEIQLIEVGEMPAGTALAERLSLPVGEQLYFYKRLFLTNGHPIFLEAEYVPAIRFPGLLDRDLLSSTTQLMEREYGVRSKVGDIVIRMATVDGNEAEALGIAPYRAVIELEQVIRDENGIAFCFDRQLWRGELAQFSARAIVS